MTFSTDHTLLSQICCDDSAEIGWREFCSKYQELINKWCKQSGINQNDFEDVFQDVLVKLFVGLRDYQPKPEVKFRSWLKTVVINTLTDRLRRLKNKPTPEAISDDRLELQTADPPDINNQLEVLAADLTEKSSAAAEILKLTRDRVSEDTWDIFVRREMQIDDVETIANQFSIKKASVYQSVSRVRNIIKQESEAYFDSSPDQ